MMHSPTHAGGIVFRRMGDMVEYLLVRSSDNVKEWVLPKGHIEPGESPEDAALREVREETGVVARMVGLAADNIRFHAKNEEVTVWFYLMEFLNETQPAENREKEWFPYEMALQHVKYKETKEAITTAEGMRSSLAGA